MDQVSGNFDWRQSFSSYQDMTIDQVCCISMLSNTTIYAHAGVRHLLSPLIICPIIKLDDPLGSWAMVISFHKISDWKNFVGENSNVEMLPDEGSKNFKSNVGCNTLQWLCRRIKQWLSGVYSFIAGSTMGHSLDQMR